MKLQPSASNAARLASYGVVDLLVSIHGATAGVHDAMTRRPGSLNETIAGIDAALAAGLRPSLNMTLSGGNHREAPDLVSFAAGRGIRTFNIQYYTPFGLASRALVPAASAAVSVRRAVRVGERTGVKVNLVNFLYCTAPDLSAMMMEDYGKERRWMLFGDGTVVNLAEYLATRRRRTGECEACANSILCRGHWCNEP